MPSKSFHVLTPFLTYIWCNIIMHVWPNAIRLKVLIVTANKCEVSANCMSKTKTIGFTMIQLQRLPKKYCPSGFAPAPPQKKILVWLRAWCKVSLTRIQGRITEPGAGSLSITSTSLSSNWEIDVSVNWVNASSHKSLPTLICFATL